ncbi:MAG TPA: hemolysin III family protein [Oscillospiraceae bacterium]|nr:hemolysin III family protein [Oscillospiraceae bacterium]
MKRIPIRERELPNYSRTEELVNMGTHIFGVVFGVAVLIVAIVISVKHQDPWAIVGSAIYGFSMIGLFTVSSVYHGMKPCTAKKVMQAIDHCVIYLLIAGSYTPILLSAIRPEHPVLAWSIFGAEWGLAALAVTLTAIDLKKFALFSMTCYLAMGWLIVMAVRPAAEALTRPGMLLLLWGGIAYTLGAVLYGLGKKKKYLHAVFHVFVDIGCVLHAVCILQYVL